MNRKQEKDSTRRDEFYEENQRFSEEGSTGFHWLTRDPQMLHIRRLADKLAKVEVPVLIIGESGTGKEVMSRYIHHQSLRRSQPFIAVNCAAIPSDLVESELFGFEKGAFSGAHAMKPGAFELADSGTLFLDEIGEMPLQVQSKLLRAVEHHRFRRIGGKQEVRVDIRILAATNQPVRQKIENQQFRGDLFYRLSVAEIELPPLRQRKEDIRFLAEYFLQKFARKYHKPGIVIEDGIMEAYQHYSWPGNVRELRNVLERAVLFSDGGEISASFLPEQPGRVNVDRHESNLLGQMNHFNSHAEQSHSNYAENSGNGKMTDGLRFIDFRHKEQPSHEWQSEKFSQKGIVLQIGSTLEKAEQLLIEKTLAHVGNNKSEAARILGCSRKTLHNKLARSG